MAVQAPALDTDPHMTVEQLEPGIWVATFFEIKKNPEHNVLQATYFGQRMDEIFLANPNRRIHFLIDATPVDRARFVSKDAREILLRLYGMPQVGKVAFIGLNAWLSAMVRIFTQITNRWDISRVFKSREEAIAWLEGKEVQPQ